MLSSSTRSTTCLCHLTVGKTCNWTQSPSHPFMLNQGTHTIFPCLPIPLFCESRSLTLISIYLTSSRHLQLLGNDKILLIVNDCNNNILVYLDSQQTIGAAVSRPPRKNLHRSKIGEACMFVFDEARRMLAICETTKVESFSQSS